MNLKKRIKIERKFQCLLLFVLMLLTFVGCDSASTEDTTPASVSTVEAGDTEDLETAEEAAEETSESTEAANVSSTEVATAVSLDSIPEYNGSPYVIINGNEPFFTDSDLTTEAFETYAPLDNLGRCGVAYANICNDIMPTAARESIGSVKPSGWKMAKYDFVDGKYLYNRCHLIGFQLAGENANPQNLITGTRYLNVTGMLPFENQIADYARYTGNHVLYRVTPIFKDSELVARGVLMEARSVETDTIRFCVYCYNVQPGVSINYADGSSQEDGSAGASNTTSTPAAQASNTAGSQSAAAPQQNATQETDAAYVINTNTHKFHNPNCRTVKDIKASNRTDVTTTRSALLSQGYTACGICKP